MTEEEVPGTVDAMVGAFLASYRTAFERRDVAAIAAHFGDAVHVASDTGSGVHLQYVARAEWSGVLERLVSQYRALDLGRADVRVVATAAVSPRLAQARVDWALFSRAGDALYEFAALYTLACEGRSCHIIAIAHDEVARSRRARGAPPGATPVSGEKSRRGSA